MYWQHVSMVCVLAACHSYGVCTGSISVWCMYWQHFSMVCVLFAVLSRSKSKVIFNVNFKTLSNLIQSAFVCV